MEVRYERDLQKNYLILEGNEKTSHNYQIMMIQENHVNGLLPFELRRMDEKVSYYYDISGKQSVYHLFQKKEITYEELRTILLEIHQLIEEVKSYLIDSSHILLEPEYLFCDYDCKNLYCVFQIDYEGDQKASLEQLAEYLVEHVDTESEEAVGIAYDFYQSIRKENFSFSYFLELLKNRNQEHMRAELEKNHSVVMEPMIDMQIQESIKVEKKPVRKIFLLQLGIVVFVILAAGIYVHVMLPDYLNEAIALYGVAAFTLTAGMTYYYLGARKTESAITEEEQVSVPMIAPQAEPPVRNVVEQDSLDSGETICLKVAPKEQKLLRGKVKNRDIIFPIEHLPCTLGKSRELVDFSIEDPSISRIHAEIIEKEDGLYLRDLNSTNGTFKNGVILETNELVKLCIRDEIQLGEIYLEYR